MKIKKTISILLTPEEVSEILKNHLKSQGFAINHIYFNVNTVHDADDLGGQPTYELTDIKCECIEQI